MIQIPGLTNEELARSLLVRSIGKHIQVSSELACAFSPWAVVSVVRRRHGIARHSRELVPVHNSRPSIFLGPSKPPTCLSGRGLIAEKEEPMRGNRSSRTARGSRQFNRRKPRSTLHQQRRISASVVPGWNVDGAESPASEKKRYCICREVQNDSSKPFSSRGCWQKTSPMRGFLHMRPTGSVV